MPQNHRLRDHLRDSTVGS